MSTAYRQPIAEGELGQLGKSGVVEYSSGIWTHSRQMKAGQDHQAGVEQIQVMSSLLIGYIVLTSYN